MTRYTHTTYPTGYATVECDGELVEITHGDPEYDVLAEKVAKHLAQSLVETAISEPGSTLVVDAKGKPFPVKPIGEQYAEALARSGRDTKWNLQDALELGWTPEEFRHWVETGEEPSEALDAPIPEATITATVAALIARVNAAKRELQLQVWERDERAERVKATGLRARLMYDAYYLKAWERLQK